MLNATIRYTATGKTLEVDGQVFDLAAMSRADFNRTVRLLKEARAVKALK